MSGIRFLLALLLRWIANKLDSNPTVQITAGVDPLPEITAGLTLAGEAVKLTGAELAVLNSPAMIAARKNQDEQAARDAIRQHAATALATGNLDGVNTDLQ